MTIRLNSREGSAGFTLIDAMIAVVILATGILALTLLQTRMLQATAEARDRSEATNVAQNLAESLRDSAARSSTGYGALTSQGLSSGVCDLTSANALKLDRTFDGAATTDYYRYCVEVTRFWACPSGVFTSDPAVCAAPSAVGFTSEYKHVELTIGWRNVDKGGTAAGDWHSLVLGDAISGIPLVNSNELQNRPLNENTALKSAEVRYPGSFFADEHNFIPIAVGNNGSGAKIAATNPTPEVIGGGVAETSYQIYTYLAQANAIQVQRQVDTKVVSCSCSLQAAPTTPSTFVDFSLRPSYWDGRRYTAPVNVKNQGSYVRGVATNLGSESEYCDVCCRDHHDPAAFDYDGADSSDPLDDFPKVDPYTNHKHYQAGTTEATSVGDAYNEVCRVARVDGIYRVTPDPAMEHFAYLPTDGDATEPTTDAMADSPSFRYNTFVRNFVKTRLNLLASLSGYTASGFLDATKTASLENDGAVLLNEQATSPQSPIMISGNDLNQPSYEEPARFLQDRAIVMDALEYPARKVIQDQINNPQNTSCLTDPLPCVLPYIPFASINLTPLTLWDTAWVKADATRTIGDAAFTISPQDVIAPDGQSVDLYAGQVGISDHGSPSAPQTDSLLGAVSRTITALVERFVLFPTPTPTDVNKWRLGDAQDFQITNAPQQGVVFQVVPSNLTYLGDGGFDNANAPDVRWWAETSPDKRGTCRFDSATKLYNCGVPKSLLDAANKTPSLVVSIRNYHQKGTVKNNENVSCADPTNPNKSIKTPYPVKCSIWEASAAVVPAGAIATITQPTTATGANNPAAADNSNPADDEITFIAGVLGNDDDVAVTFRNQVLELLPGRRDPICNTATGVAQNWTFNSCRSD